MLSWTNLAWSINASERTGPCATGDNDAGGSPACCATVLAAASDSRADGRAIADLRPLFDIWPSNLVASW
jgi:hypothetical protein